MINLPIDNRYKIDFAKPVFTLDINQIAIRPPAARPPEYAHLASIEYNYFHTGLVEVAVTPEAEFEITGGVPDQDLGWSAYQRFTKSQWFKGRPSGSTLSLDAQQSNELWLDMRYRLWPTVTGDQLTANQRADVSQLFFHTVSSGSTVSNSVFVTQDQNFITKADHLYEAYGVQIMTSGAAWHTFQPRYSLVTPSSEEAEHMWQNQHDLLKKLWAGMG